MAIYWSNLISFAGTQQLPHDVGSKKVSQLKNCKYNFKPLRHQSYPMMDAI